VGDAQFYFVTVTSSAERHPESGSDPAAIRTISTTTADRRKHHDLDRRDTSTSDDRPELKLTPPLVRTAESGPDNLRRRRDRLQRRSGPGE
jgi:hypothetical protein